MFVFYRSLFLMFNFIHLVCSVEVQTKYGIVRGLSHYTRLGKKYVAFRGLRYAAPPIGPNRLKEPQPLEPWDGVIDAFENGEECMQVKLYSQNVTGSEDCLFLNVFTPHITDEGNIGKLPVMVWIHGGRWSSGTIKYYSPDALVAHNIVLVTINYRLGTLGFISANDVNLPGNFGLKDQVAALKWVQENIAYFNGDVQRITIFGQETGGASVHYHMLSPLSKGLFHGAISMSGTALCPWAATQDRTFYVEAFANLVGCNVRPASDFVECLRTKDGKEIMMSEYSLIRKLRVMDSIVFKPVVEGNWNGAFLSGDPLELLQDGNLEISIPWIVGISSNEGGNVAEAVYNNNTMLDSVTENFDDVIPLSLYYGRTSSSVEIVTKELKKFYFHDLPVDSTPLIALSDMYTDGLFLWNVDESVRLHSLINSEPIYYYVFSYHGGKSSCGHFKNHSVNFGACHGDEIDYLFPTDDIYQNESDKKMVEIMTGLWTTFATYKNPNNNSILKAEWECVTSHEVEFLNISTTLSSGYGLYHERSQFWASLPIRGKHSDLGKFSDEL